MLSNQTSNYHNNHYKIDGCEILLFEYFDSKKNLFMFGFSNENKRIFYICHVININSYLFQEFNVNCPIIIESSSNESESVRMQSYKNSNTSVRIGHTTFTNEINAFQNAPLDLSLPTRARNKCQTDEYCSLSMPSITQHVSHCIINTQQYLAKDSSSENEEIDVVAIDSNDSNNHSTLVVSDNGGNQIERPIFQDSALQNYFPSHPLQSNISEEVNSSCSKPQYNHHHKNDYNITRSDNIPSSSKDNLVHFIPFVGVITNAAQLNIREDDVVPRLLEYQCVLPSETIPQQCSLNLLPIKEPVICNNIVAEDNIYLPVSKTIPDTTRSFINTNNDIDNPKRPYRGVSYESSVVKKLVTEPPRKVYKHILPVGKKNCNSMPSTSQNIRMTTHKDIMHTKNQLESGHTFLSTYDVEENPRRCVITDVNTQQETSNNTDLNSPHVKRSDTDSNYQISMKNYVSTNNDEASLEKLSGEQYKFSFIVNDTFLYRVFDQTEGLHLFLKISIPIIEIIDFKFAKSVFNVSARVLHKRHYVYSIPIFHTVNFLGSNNIEYFEILLSLGKYELQQRFYISIYQSSQEEELKLRLKCPLIRDFKKLIDKFLGTTFPIYPFPPKRHNYIRFQSLYSLGEPIKEMTLQKCIENVTENPLDLNMEQTIEYMIDPEFQNGKIKEKYKKRISWNSGLQIASEVLMTFDTNIKQILTIINKNSELSNFDMTEINNLFNQIIEKININFRIKYPSKVNSDDHEKESELMSFYVFSINEFQILFEWWNKYIFISEKVKYIETSP